MPNIVKNTTNISLLDLLAPHSCRGCGRIGTPICNRCKNNIIFEHFENPPKIKLPKSFPPTFIVCNRVELTDILIHDFKYNSVRALALPLAEILHQIIPKIAEPTIIVPLPTIAHHIRTRGLDHTYLIAKKLAKLRHCSVQKLLIRNQNTIQVGTDRKTRIAQANNAYTINPNIKINRHVNYILLDDVWTTGASMKAAVKLLQKSGAQKITTALLALSI